MIAATVCPSNDRRTRHHRRPPQWKRGGSVCLNSFRAFPRAGCAQSDSRFPHFLICSSLSAWQIWGHEMGKPHPMALRERVVEFVEEGHSHRASAAQFRVSVKFVNDMVILKRETCGACYAVVGRKLSQAGGPHAIWLWPDSLRSRPPRERNRLGVSRWRWRLRYPCGAKCPRDGKARSDAMRAAD